MGVACPLSIYISRSYNVGTCGFGDPHYTTLDNREYTFNAEGVYTLFGVSAKGSEIFHLQGRLGPRGWPATTTVALSFGIPGVYGYQVKHFGLFSGVAANNLHKNTKPHYIIIAMLCYSWL